MFYLATTDTGNNRGNLYLKQGLRRKNTGNLISVHAHIPERHTLYAEQCRGGKSKVNNFLCFLCILLVEIWCFYPKKPFSIMHRYISGIKHRRKWLFIKKKHHQFVHLRRLKTTELHKTSFNPHIFSPVTLTRMTPHSILKMEETGLDLELGLLSQVYKDPLADLHVTLSWSAHDERQHKKKKKKKIHMPLSCLLSWGIQLSGNISMLSENNRKPHSSGLHKKKKKTVLPSLEVNERIWYDVTDKDATDLHSAFQGTDSAVSLDASAVLGVTWSLTDS